MAIPSTTNVNGTAYGWSMVEVVILGRALTGIQAINYSDSQEIESVRGVGNRPIAIGEGPITYEGSITLLMEELEALRLLVPGGRIQEIPPFDIIVSFVVPGSTKLTKHILKACKFKKNSREMDTDSKFISTEIELHISNIQF